MGRGPSALSPRLDLESSLKPPPPPRALVETQDSVSLYAYLASGNSGRKDDNDLRIVSSKFFNYNEQSTLVFALLEQWPHALN